MTKRLPPSVGTTGAKGRNTEHLRKVDRDRTSPHLDDIDLALGVQRCSARIYVHDLNKGFPPNDSWLSVSVFGEAGYFMETETLLGVLAWGFRLRVNY